MNRGSILAMRITLVAIAALAVALLPSAPVRAQTPVLAKAEAEKLPAVRVEVQELKRTSGDLVMLKFAVINDSDQPVKLNQDRLAGPRGDRGTISGVYLLEPNSKQKITVARDERRKCVCSHISPLKPKSSMVLWAKFPAPGPDAEKVSIIIPEFTPMEDVPLSR